MDGGVSLSLKTTTKAPMAVPYRTGDVVVVQALKVQEITDSKSDVLLKFPNGDLLTAYLKDNFTGKEGDFFSIRIQSFDDNRIYAQMVSNTNNLKTLKNEITHMLTSLNLPNNTDNYRIAMQLLKSGIAQTKYNFDLFIKYKNLNPKATFEQIAYMIKNKLPINNNSLKIVDLLVSHQGLIGESLLFLLRNIIKDNKNDQLKNIIKNFYKDPSGSNFNYKEISSSTMFNDLVNILSYIVEHKSLGENTKKLVQAFKDSTSNEFGITNQLQNIAYAQIPININGLFTTVELYILKDKKNENQEKMQNTFFLRIPTKNLGIIEFLLKMDTDKSIQCHINAEKHLDELKDNMVILSQMIGNIGFKITKVTYNHLPSDVSINNFEKYARLIMDAKKIDWRV